MYLNRLDSHQEESTVKLTSQNHSRTQATSQAAMPKKKNPRSQKKPPAFREFADRFID